MSIIGPNKKKYAVIIGINYTGTKNELSGCINDANNIKQFLTVRCNYPQENIQLLADDNVSLPPTKANILASFDTLVEKAVNEGYEELWLSYSGHGSYVKDENGDEEDGCDETICPIDFSKSGLIIDDVIYSELVAKLPKNVTLFGLMDCCHSGTIFDLPFIYNIAKKRNNTNASHRASVISISGCKDYQTSADANIDGKFAGAMTWSFLKVMKEANYNINIVRLIDEMRKILHKDGYSQKPMLAVSDESQYEKNMLEINEDRPLVSDDGKPMKSILFEISVDKHFWESSWNIWSEDKAKFIFEYNKTFKVENDSISETVNLEYGKYKLHICDKSGDGGVKSAVRDGSKILTSGIFTCGKNVDYYLTVEK
jgi:hypothetical protein